MAAARGSDTATLLDHGTVLVAGGINFGFLESAEIYDPTTGTFSPTGSLATARSEQAAALLVDGTVLVAGGFNSQSKALASAEIYDPATGTWR